MSSIEQQAKAKKDQKIRYLDSTNIPTAKKPKKYCRFKKSGIKYIDYKDPNFLIKLVNNREKYSPEDSQAPPKNINGKWHKPLNVPVI